ncbi:hypothetical protein ACIKP7_03200 [Pseudomonas caricapapayae]|uniref:Uncharacterized protein n=1 Tax=Pseudomonas caricapapayae TaxID=46678 RepID=A0ACC7LQH8_9PSED
MNGDLTPPNTTQGNSDLLEPKIWTVGQTLRISFIGTTGDALKKAIYDTACEWSKYANLNFERVDDNEGSAEIRIFAYSKIHYGFDADVHVLATETGERPSSNMNFVFETESIGDPGFVATILIEFGRILGMEPAQFHPEANIPWNFDSLRKLVRSTLDEQASDAEVEEALRSRMPPITGKVQLSLGYDIKSIMHVPISTEITVGGWKSELNSTLSEKDKRFMALVYPGRS